MTAAATHLAAVRAGIVATCKAVPEIGVVHDHERFDKRADALASLYIYTPTEGDPPTPGPAKAHLRAWSVALDGLDETPLDSARAAVTATWRIVGVMALIDAWRSQVLFEDLLGLAAAAFRADPTLGGVLDRRAENRAGLKVRSVQPMSFAGVLCHAARCSLTTVFDVAAARRAAGLADYLRTHTVARLPDLPADAVTYTDLVHMRPHTEEDAP